MEGSLGAFSLSQTEQTALWVVLFIAVAALAYGAMLMVRILRLDRGTPEMIEIAEAIQDGANAYLKRQLSTLAFFVLLLAVVLYVTAAPEIALGRAAAFVVGAVFSALAGFIGMSLAVRGNVRTAAASRIGFKPALSAAFQTGVVAGMFTVGLGLLGITGILIMYGSEAGGVLMGFGFGGALLALFMRVGGGIFTKAADVGADLVGKLEQGIPEDDPRNAAVIADNVGDNVGDCAGMAADLFESYGVTLAASIILGFTAYPSNPSLGVVFPLMVGGLGIISSILGTLVVRVREDNPNVLAAINRGFFLSSLLALAGLYVIATTYLHDMRAFWATAIGLLLAVAISLLTEHYTSTKRKPVREIARSSNHGAATTILSGMSAGKESSVLAVLAISLAISAAVFIAGAEQSYVFYAVSLIGLGMLAGTGMIVSMDTFGPVADNANGILEMSKLGDEKASAIIAELDAVGNTTKAITKGFAITSAVIAAISLFGSFVKTIGDGKIVDISLTDPTVFVGLLLGGAVPYLFASLTISAVGRGAMVVVQEVRRQFKEIPGIMEYLAKPDYARITDICTKTALRELIAPGILAIFTPILVGFTLHEYALGGFLAGAILSGQLLAVYMSNAGGAWDNAKKLVEDGHHGGKGSDSHHATVVGDTVGDPFKDTAGPALNPLIKVMNLVSLLIAPMVLDYPNLNITSGLIVLGAALLIMGGIVLSKRDFAIIEEAAVKQTVTEVA